ncbi:hypothetical protein [Pseudomonas chlororaphis]|uniref:hypothetical protein n=1 Tax=Pseudomonas chlororaphis TaxID=587753 RepID=UPI000F56F03A|nr:hypothetical protein [Pseudomonas chlororaphis]
MLWRYRVSDGKRQPEGSLTSVQSNLRTGLSLSLVPRWPAVSAEGKTECNQAHSGSGQPSRESRDTDSNAASDKKMSLKNPYRTLLTAPFPPYVANFVEPFRVPKKLPRAYKYGACELNNVLDFTECISFFQHKAYEKFFLASAQDVLSSVVTSLKRFDL